LFNLKKKEKGKGKSDLGPETRPKTKVLIQSKTSLPKHGLKRRRIGVPTKAVDLIQTNGPDQAVQLASTTSFQAR